MGQQRRGRRNGRWTKAASLLIGVLIAAAGPVGAASAQALLSSPIDISFCLCLQRDIETRQGEMAIRRNAYESSVKDIQDTEAGLDRDRPRVNVDDPAQVDDFRRRVDALEALKTRLAEVTLPDYQAAVTGYNERVAQYTGRCSGALDPNVVARVRPNLICRMDNQP
jgi:hypothetical protein